MSSLTKETYTAGGVSYAQLTLHDGDTAVSIVPEKGGMIVSLRRGSEEFLWLRHPNFEGTDRPRCGVPILWPSVAKPEGGVHHFGGADYPMENHGFADLLPWQVESADDAGITLTLAPNGLTKFVYPFDFLLSIRYTLTEGKVSLALTVKNTGDKPLPFSFGFHPYFAASKLENVRFAIHAATCSTSPMGEQPAAPETITLTKTPGAVESVRLLTGVQSPMQLFDSGNGHHITVEFDQHFGHAVLWQQDAESFVCMEPWNGWRNSVNEAGKHEELSCGKTYCAQWSIAAEKQ